MKKFSALALTALLSMGAISAAFADTDDAAWIDKCVKDNQRENQTPEAVKKYCTCMNGKMSSSETLSVSAWEKTHPAEEAACDKEAGWVGK